jgi:hypothetical protein
MGETHFRSDVKEKNSGTTVGFSKVEAGTYVKCGNLYIISGAPTAFTDAGVNAIATLALGATPADIPRGTIFMNASVNAAASTLILVKVSLGSWSGTGVGGAVLG